MKKQYFYYISLIMAQLMVGINIVASKTIVDDFSISLILFWRFVIATGFLLTFYYLNPMKRIVQNPLKLSDLKKRDWIFMTSQALCAGVLFNLMLLWGLNYTSAGVAGIITSVLPAIIAILSILFLGERLTLFNGLCITFAILGLFIINAGNFKDANFSNLIGDLIILLSLLPEAGYYVLAKIHVNKLPLFLTAALMNAINIPITLIALAFTNQIHVSASTYDVIMLLIIGLATGLFYVFWFWGSRNVKGSISGLFTATMPLSTLVLAWLFLDESITYPQLTGMLMVIASILFNAKKS